MAEEEHTDINPWVVSKLAKQNEGWLDKNREKLLARHDVTDPYFAVWLEMFDIIVRSRVHLSYRDLEDWDYWAAYSGETTPRDAAKDMFEDFGYDWVVL